MQPIARRLEAVTADLRGGRYERAVDGCHRILGELPGEPLPGGLLIDRNGHPVVVLLDGSVVCYGPQAEPRAPGNVRD